MSVERTFYCNGPDCERHVRSLKLMPPGGFLTLIDEGHESHFCGWDCVLRLAATKEPETVIPMDES